MKQKQIINDSAYNKFYPFPQYLSKKTAFIVLCLIILLFIDIFLVSISGL